MEQFQMIEKLNEELKEKWLEYWLAENFLTMQWWIIVACFVLPYGLLFFM